ncbi:alpha-1,2-fucosyltransferase [Bacillus dakarensis]|uniref:alpha-1,2-fucosyltransferase n=1 Tax=Robertmurraya dakarensis TaxID=1926278 RepID=UPI000981A20E|nr:alpha-1,2-fucosyltransferase [Bacillus dakarensis]
MKKQVIAMTTLGKNGRFGNQIFQYAFLKIYGKVFGLEVQTPRWIGNYLFNARDPKVSKRYPTVVEDEFKNEVKNIGTIDENVFEHEEPPYTNVDLWGYFQFHTSHISSYKDYVRSLFTPVPSIESFLQKGMTRLRSKGKTIIGLHLRRGDYLHYKDSELRGFFYAAPTEWYKELLEQIWPTLEEPVLFIASDDIDSVIHDFSEYSPITSNNIFDQSEMNQLFPNCNFYPDFYLLSQCDVMAISNSSFSFAASMLNVNGKSFYRPIYKAKSLVPYDPWSSRVLLWSQP